MTFRSSRKVTGKGVELSCELNYAISLWRWILLCKNSHFLEISIFWKYPQNVDIIHISWIYSYFMDIIRILWKYQRFVDIIRIFCVLFLTFYSSSESEWCTPGNQSATL